MFVESCLDTLSNLCPSLLTLVLQRILDFQAKLITLVFA